jgi:N-acetylmuramoyl-L-alanine amidase
MSRQSWLVAGFLNQIVLVIISANGAHALNAGETNSILSCVENDRANQITLTTRLRAPISAPMVSYLPGEDGEAIMTADFDGLAYTLPTRIIKVGDDSVRQRGIREIRIGQLQANPPVCRVSIVTSDLRALKALNFKASSGILMIRWGADRGSAKNSLAYSSSAGYASPQSNSSPQNYASPLSQNYASPAPQTSSSPQDYSSPQKYSSPQRYSLPQNYSSTQNFSSQGYSARKGNTASPGRALSQGSAGGLTGNSAVTSQGFQTRSSANSSWTSQQTGQPVTGREDGNGITSYGNQKDNLAPTLRRLPRDSARSAEITTWSSSELLKKPPVRNSRSATRDATGSFPTGIAASSNAITDGKPAEDLLGAYPEERKAPVISLAMERDPGITDQSAAVFRLKIKSEHSLTYNTFRLNNPERYVIDFSNCPELVDAQLPDVEGSEFIRSVRVGQPDDPGKTRLVIDLINEPVTIKEQVQREANLLTIRLSRAIEAADNAASQVPVPTGTTIVLDAGHGGSDPGAQRGDIQEKEITLGIIERLKRRLEARGFRITLTRADDTFVSLEDRVRITNSLQPALFLSVHINAMESANDIHGIETYYQTEQSRALADAIHENLVTKLDAPDRAVRKARFYVINHTPVPAVLAEVGFISNKDERDKLISSDYQIKVANALEQGVMLYLDKKLAKVQADPTRALEARDYNRSQSGTILLSGKSHNTSIAQRKNQFEDSTR